MKHVKIFNGQPRRFALLRALSLSLSLPLSLSLSICLLKTLTFAKSFPPDHIDQAEMNYSTMLSNETSTA